jgi:hypothetical protein
MSSTYTVKSGDTFYDIFVEAKRQDKELRYITFEKVNKHIKDFESLKIGDTINIPTSKKPAGSTTAEPKEGKCGNEFTFKPRGRNATSMQISCSVNGKKSPPLEADKTYINEQDKLEKSQTGKLEVTINGKSFPIMEDLAELKKDISRHKDVKVDITVIDKAILTPASPKVIDNILKENIDLQVKIPETFRSPDQHATMNPEELLASMQIAQPKVRTLKGLGINLPPVKKHTIVTFEIPPSLPMDEGIKNIDTMSDEEIEKLTDAIIAGGTKAGATLLATLASLAGTESKRIFWKQQLWKGKFSITSGLNGSKLIHFYGTPNLTSMLTGVTDPKMIEKIKKAAINPGTKYKMGKGFAGIQLKASLPFFEGTKLGYLEKFLNGKTAMGGVVVASIFSGSVATYKWYHNKESQDIDLLAIWGVVIAKTLIGAGIVALAVSLVISVGFTSIIVGIGVGVAAAVVGGFIIEAGASYLGIDNKSTQAIRSARDNVKEFINDTTDSLLGRDINLNKSLLR